jgi:hypothetical protein
MFFCEKNCGAYLQLFEELTEKNERILFYRCTKCNYKVICNTKQFEVRNYIQTKKLYINKETISYKTQDITLPKKKSNCVYCKTTNLNRFERKCVQNIISITNICSNCFCSF